MNLPVHRPTQLTKSECNLISSVALAGHPRMFNFLGVSYVTPIENGLMSVIYKLARSANKWELHGACYIYIYRDLHQVSYHLDKKQ